MGPVWYELAGSIWFGKNWIDFSNKIGLIKESVEPAYLDRTKLVLTDSCIESKW